MTTVGTARTGHPPVRVRPGLAAVAGVVSTLVFTWVHDLMISDIWAMTGVMAIAGAICGACLALSYGALAEQPSVGGWLRHNLEVVASLVILGACSVAVFDPVVTMAEVVAANQSADELIVRALPLTAAVTVATAGVLTRVHRRGWSAFVRTLLAIAVVMLVLGLNVSAIGLVSVPAGDVVVLARLFGLVALLATVFVVVSIGLAWRPQRSRSAASTP